MPYEVYSPQMPKSFMDKDYRQHWSQILFDREQITMPEAQELIRVRRQELEYRSMANEYNKEMEKIQSHLFKLQRRRDNYYRKMNRVIRIYERGLQGQDLRNVDQMLEDIANGGRGTGAAAGEADGSEATRRSWVCRCPRDECRGFIQNRSYKCGTCDGKICKDCRIPLTEEDEEHECNTEDIETVQAIQRDCKPCPNCGVHIHKIIGCDQMWCTQCQTTFSWRTGRIVTGHVHNPHYFEYMRANGGGNIRAPGDLLCGGLPRGYQLNRCFTRNGREFLTKEEYTRLSDVLRVATHIQHVVIPPIREDLQTQQSNRDLQVEFLMNRLTEDDMKRQLATREKTRRKKRDILGIWETFITVCTESFNDFINRMNEMDATYTMTQQELLDLCTRLNGLIDYVNETFKKAKKTHRLKVPQLVMGTQEDRWDNGRLKISSI